MKNEKLAIFNLFVMCIIICMFSACTSMQKDFFVNIQRDQMETNLAELEGLIIPLEAAGGSEARKRQDELTSARRMVGSMEKEAAADADYSARLCAWSGRLAILEGKYSEAQRLYRQSQALSPGNIPSIILGIRLEGDPAKRLELAEKELTMAEQHGELNIEKARSLLELRRFAEASGAFDTAFNSGLNAVYRESYQSDRDHAWELRRVGDDPAGSSGTLGVLERGSLNWRDCITITKNETQLFRFLTGGRDISETELFNRLLERAFIPYTQDVTATDWPATRPRIDDPVFRSGAAWFIWHLYAEARADRGLLSRYSARFATGPNPRSPIADVPPLSPFFDSILGCVETEFLSLPDGRNFRSTELIRGAEFLSVLKKVDG